MKNIATKKSSKILGLGAIVFAFALVASPAQAGRAKAAIDNALNSAWDVHHGDAFKNVDGVSTSVAVGRVTGAIAPGVDVFRGGDISTTGTPALPTARAVVGGERAQESGAAAVVHTERKKPSFMRDSSPAEDLADSGLVVARVDVSALDESLSSRPALLKALSIGDDGKAANGSVIVDAASRDVGVYRGNMTFVMSVLNQMDPKFLDRLNADPAFRTAWLNSLSNRLDTARSRGRLKGADQIDDMELQSIVGQFSKLDNTDALEGFNMIVSKFDDPEDLKNYYKEHKADLEKDPAAAEAYAKIVGGKGTPDDFDTLFAAAADHAMAKGVTIGGTKIPKVADAAERKKLIGCAGRFAG